MGNTTSFYTTPGFLSEKYEFSAFSDKEIEEWSIKFHEKYPAGQISDSDFQKIIRLYFKDGNPDKFCKKFISILKNKKQGNVTFHDLLSLFSKIWTNHESKIDFLFKFYDWDEDGNISMDDLTNCYLSIVELTNDECDMKRFDKEFVDNFRDEGNVCYEEFKKRIEDENSKFYQLNFFK